MVRLTLTQLGKPMGMRGPGSWTHARSGAAGVVLADPGVKPPEQWMLHPCEHAAPRLPCAAMLAPTCSWAVSVQASALRAARRLSLSAASPRARAAAAAAASAA